MANATPIAATSLIKGSDITKVFATDGGKTKTTVLEGVSIDVQPGEYIAIVGSSGSGKSTLLYCLSGLERVTSGGVALLGEPLQYIQDSANLSPKQSAGIGFVFQSYQLLKFLTVSENIILPAKYSGMAKEAYERLPALLDELGLTDKADAKVSSLSGGQQQRVAIARALISQPSLIFADEPTGALDTKNAQEVARILESIPNSQRSVVMVTHDLEMAARASRILILSDGQIVRQLGKSTSAEILSAMKAAKSASEKA